MNWLAKFLLSIFGLALSLTASICVMMFGWGLYPRSWAWIIGCGFFVQVLAQITIEVSKIIKGDE